MPSDAQERVTAIQAFRGELDRLAAEGLSVDPDVVARISAHHDAILASLAAREEVDLTRSAARLSAGMRVATLLGAIALSAAYALFVSAHWSALALPVQLLLLIVPPVTLTLLIDVAAARERSGYVASIIATVAIIAFITDLSVVGFLYGVPDSRRLLLGVGILGLLLAYAFRLDLPLLIGSIAGAGWLWSLLAIPRGIWWREAYDGLEPMLVLGFLAMVVPAVVRGSARFATWWRVLGAGAVVVALLMLQDFGNLSMLVTVPIGSIEAIYQVVATVVFIGLIAWSLRYDHPEVARIAVAGAVGFLFLRFTDWFWDRLAHWLFFLALGALALLVLLVLRRWRSRAMVTA